MANLPPSETPGQAGGRPTSPPEPPARGLGRKTAWKSHRMFQLRNAGGAGTEARQECDPQGRSNTSVSHFPFYRE